MKQYCKTFYYRGEVTSWHQFYQLHKAHKKSKKKQAVAELGQTQVKLEVVNDVVVKVMI